MRQAIDNFHPVRIGIALILLILSIVFGVKGEIFPIYMTAVLGSLFFFDIFNSYMVIGPGLTIISTLIIFGRRLMSDGFFLIFFMLTPFMSIFPEVGFIRPTSIFIMVDLPAPLEPMSATLSPRRMSRFRPSKTTWGSPLTLL